ERLAKHYGVPHVYGSRFRRVELGPDRQRGGLLRQGSVLTVTSYATRTSPVLRGKWVLENVLGTPPPPPPADVPSLKDDPLAAPPPPPRALGAPPSPPRLRELPPPDRPGRLPAGTVRRRRPLAAAGRGQAGRCGRRAPRRQRLRGRGRAGEGAAP